MLALLPLLACVSTTRTAPDSISKPNVLLIEKVKNGFLVSLSFRIQDRWVVPSLLITKRPDGEIGFDCSLDEAFYRDLAVRKLRRLNLSPKPPPGDDQTERQQEPQKSSSASIVISIAHGLSAPFSKAGPNLRLSSPSLDHRQF